MSESARLNEILSKIETVRAVLENHHLAGIVLRGVDWFSWATGGGSSVVILTSEQGIADVFITRDGAWI
jgi:hypothetical protein